MRRAYCGVTNAFNRGTIIFVRDGKRKVSVSVSPVLLVYSGGGDSRSGCR